MSNTTSGPGPPAPLPPNLPRSCPVVGDAQYAERIGTAPGSVTTQVRNHTPSGNSPASSAATSKPAGSCRPRLPRQCDQPSVRTAERFGDIGLTTDQLVIAGRRFPGFESRVRNGREAVRRPGACS